MLIKEVDPYEVNWDSLVNSLPEGTIFQTTYWARYLERSQKIKPIFLVAQDEKGNILGSLLLYRSYLLNRFLNSGIPGKLVFKIINFIIPTARWHFGPLIYDKSNFKDIFESLLKNAIKLMKKQGIVFFRNVCIPIHGDRDYMKNGEEILSNLNFKCKNIATILIDLKKKENELWGGLKNSARKSIKKNCALDLVISSMGREQLREYFKVLLESRRRSGVELPPLFPNEEMWEELGRDKKFLELFSVTKNGVLLGAIGVLSYNAILLEIGPAQADYAYKNKIYTNDILKWYIIKRGIAMNARLYDLHGIYSNPKKEKEKKQNQFKEKWGGEKVLYKYYSKFL